MSIGQALAEARQQAGLTVADVGQRTRIREGIIRGIEADDFSVCGGDFYARGHIRSIAKVVGADPIPLVAEYDQVWRDQGGTTDVRHVMDLITESRSAPPVESAAGPLADADTGPLAEPVTGPLAGPVTGPLGEPVTGPLAGPVTEPGAGPLTGPGAGPLAGQEAGPVAGQEAGPVAGHEAGPVAGHEAEPVAGQEAGPVMEPPTDPGAGPVIEPPSAPGPMREQGAGPSGQPGTPPSGQPGAWPHQPPRHEPSPHQPPLRQPPLRQPRLRQPSPHQPSLHQPSPHQPDTGTTLGDSARWGTSGPPPWRTAAAGRHSSGSTPPHRRLNWTAVLAVAVVVAFGLIGYELMSSGGGQPPPAAAPAASGKAATQHPAEHGSGTPVPQRTRQTPAPAAPSPSPTPPRATAAPPSAGRSLTPASATAFGPSGNGQGDNTDLAHLAVDSSPGSAWHTDWYTSASFGNLYSGTGLLVDLGHPATITAARISLGSAPGAGFELRVGSSPSALRTVARADGVSGLVNLRLSSPVQGRYLLIWFTRLPDAAGTFEASVHDVKVTVRS